MTFEEHEFKLKKGKGKAHVGAHSPPMDTADEPEKTTRQLHALERGQEDETHKKIAEEHS